MLFSSDKTAKTQIIFFLPFDFKTDRQLDCVSVRSRCVIMRVYRPKFLLWHVSLVLDATVIGRYQKLISPYEFLPVFNKVSKILYGTFHVHHLLERGLISEITK